MYLTILILIVVANIIDTGWAYEITSIDVITNIIAQQDAESQLRTAQSNDIWQNATFALSNLNSALNTTLNNIANLYDPVGASLLITTIKPDECTVFPHSQYIANATLIHITLCCHIRKMRIPALFLVVSRANFIFHGVDKDDDFGSTASALQGLQTMQFIDEKGIIISTCLDDTSIFLPELAVVRAIAALEIIAALTESYNAMRIDAQSLSGCLSNPLSGCNQTVPLLWDQVKPNTAFADYDSSYTETCDLSSFIIQQNSASCSAFGI